MPDSHVQHLEFTPPEALQDIIHCFWYNERYEGEEDYCYEVIPDAYTEIIFYFESNCDLVCNGELLPLSSPFMVGLLRHPLTFQTKKCLKIIGVRCYPWTIFDLLGLSSDQNGVQTFEHPVVQLQLAMETAIHNNQKDEALKLVEDFFLKEKSRIAIDPALFKAGTILRNTGGQISVSQAAEAAHLTVRTLERKFKRSSGYTVKDISSLMRFEQVRNHLWLNPETNLAGLAHELGYTDQSHLSREFKRYSGTTPAAFARKAQQR